MEDFVPYELAVKLKEKGFNEDSWFHYDTDGDIVTRGYRLNHPDDVPAWTLQMAMKWLRKVKKIYIVIAVNPALSTKDKIAYYYQIYFNSTDVGSEYYGSKLCYAQWEECAIDSIKHVLNNLI